MSDDERCRCGHPWDEHDGMGDCCHPDGRTLTGLCNRCAPAPPETTPKETTTDD